MNCSVSKNAILLLFVSIFLFECIFTEGNNVLLIPKDHILDTSMLHINVFCFLAD